ncbi:hypothetical protein MTR67_052513 [Solanum verrucosum]|uniref:Uncharacterized protein n=1 Tax=Solanum verrucosum TaxID=315347 RepID=A0AAF0V9B7_SOLVR|nr:hypothetical protein MTR67_052513 [Solanum verrucosum]
MEEIKAKQSEDENLNELKKKTVIGKAQDTTLNAEGFLQRMSIPEWKWERIAMDYVVGLPKTLRKFDSIWVVVDRLTKSAHFILVRIDYNAKQLAKVYVKEIVRLQEVPISIILDRDENFFLKDFDFRGIGESTSSDDEDRFGPTVNMSAFFSYGLVKALSMRLLALVYMLWGPDDDVEDIREAAMEDMKKTEELELKKNQQETKAIETSRKAIPSMEKCKKQLRIANSDFMEKMEDKFLNLVSKVEEKDKAITTFMLSAE